MNKLLLNSKGRNHIKLFPMKDLFDDIPEDEGDKIRWCESKYLHLQHSDDANRLLLHKNKAKGYLISVWELEGYYYLINCIRVASGAFVTTIYITKDGNDAKSIAGFLQQNVEEIMSDTKQSLLDYYKAVMDNDTRA